MSYFERIWGRLNRDDFPNLTLVVFGLGVVGAPIALSLARLGPGRLVLVDGDTYAEHNRLSHLLPAGYVGQNKADAMADYLVNVMQVPVGEVIAVPEYVRPDDDRAIRDLIAPSRLIVVATDRIETNRFVALAARDLDRPAIVPGISADGGRGEVFVSLTEREPCVVCADGFRPVAAPIRGASMLDIDRDPTVATAVRAALALIDPDSRDADLFDPLWPDGPTPQLFVVFPTGAPELRAPDDGRRDVPWRPDCPGCGGAPEQRRGLAPAGRGPAPAPPRLLIGSALAVIAVVSIVVWTVLSDWAERQRAGIRVAPPAHAAPVQPKPTRPAPPAPRPSHPLIGAWQGRGHTTYAGSGIVIAENPDSFELFVSINSTQPGTEVGDYQYSYDGVTKGECAGTLRWGAKVGASTYRLRQRETLHPHDCQPAGTVRVTLDRGEMRWQVEQRRPPGHRSHTTARLTKE
jgi:ThiF family protein